MRGSAIIAGNLSIIAVVLAAAALAPVRGEPVAVVVSPFATDDEAVRVIARAGGRLVAGTRLPWIAVARSPGDDFHARLRAAGAWAVLAPLASGCGRPTNGTKT